jgi:hypothetical protein
VGERQRLPVETVLGDGASQAPSTMMIISTLARFMDWVFLLASVQTPGRSS